MTADGLDAGRLLYGADYAPEQWPDAQLDEDLALMREAGVNRVSLGMFAWARLEPEPGHYEDAWLERVLDGLHAAGIGANLATPTASPPLWLLRAHPEVQAVGPDGRRVPPGGRLSWCPSSPVLREHAARIVEHVGARFGGHPAVRLWHVSNELGNENAECLCDDCAAAFRVWLAERYGTVEALDEAWGAAFWGHQHASFEDVTPPVPTRNPPDPALALDYRRFRSDALLAHYRRERDILARVAPGVPATTNLMVAQAADPVDYAVWARELAVVANDHYAVAADPDRRLELALSADRTRGLAGGDPWLLMEHAPSAVNWQPRNRAKEPGEMLRDALAHVARGADGAMFFQWRASRSGSEQFHSAMVPHAGTESRVWREAVALGAVLARLAPVRGSRVERADVALLWDVPSHWAMRSAPPPTVDLRYETTPARLHAALVRRRIAVDVVPPETGLDGRRVLLVASQYLAVPGLAARLLDAARAGAHVVVAAPAGVVDATARVVRPIDPESFAPLIGAVVEEFAPLQEGEGVTLDTGWRAAVWTERLRPFDAEIVARHATGSLTGEPAVLRRAVGAGSVTYVSVELEPESIAALVAEVAARAGLAPIADADDGLELVRRVAEDGSRYLFCSNPTDRPAAVRADGVDLVTGEPVAGRAVVPAGGVAVIATTPTERGRP